MRNKLCLCIKYGNDVSHVTYERYYEIYSLLLAYNQVTRILLVNENCPKPFFGGASCIIKNVGLILDIRPWFRI